MKKAKPEAIINAVGRHLTKRNYTDSDILKRNKLKLGQTSEQFEKCQIWGSNKIIALQHCNITEHEADIQYSRLKSWIETLDKVSVIEMQNLLFPIFISLYTKLNSSGNTSGARSFYSRHQSNFLKVPEFRAMAEKIYSDSSNHLKFTLELSQDTFEMLNEYLASSDHLILLHLLNTTVEIITENRLEKAANVSPSTHVKSDVDSMLNSAEEVQDLMSVVSRMNQLPPPPPLLKMFTVDTGQRKVTSASISCTSGYLCCSFQDSSLAIWNTKKVLHLPEPSTSSLDLACSIGCHHAHRSSSVSPPLPATACTESAVFCHGHTGPVYSVQFTPATYSSSPHLLSASDDTTLRLWSMDTMENVVVYRGHTYAVWDTDISPSSQFFVSCSQDRTAKLWAFDRTYPLRILAGHSSDVDCVTFHPNGMYVASGSADRSVRMWSITDGNTVRVLVGHRGTVLAVSFSPCGKYLASAGEDRRVKVWDVASSTTIHDYRGHNDVVHGLVWLSDALLASYSTDGSVRVWNIQQPSSSVAGASPNASCTEDFASYTVPAQWKPVSLAAGQRGSLVCIAASD